jgi:hypothetical protein
MAPMAMPGNYYAVIRIGKDSAEVPFTVLPDPNYKVTAEEYRKQQEFLLAARNKFSETMKALKNINDIRKQMNEYSGRLADSLPKEVKAEMDSINKKMTAVEESLHQTKAKSGQDVLNYPIKLDDKLSSVYSIAGQGYGAPAKQVMEAYTDVAGQIDEQLKKLNDVISQDLPKLNAMIREKNLPVISVKK